MSRSFSDVRRLLDAIVTGWGLVIVDHARRARRWSPSPFPNADPPRALLHICTTGAARVRKRDRGRMLSHISERVSERIRADIGQVRVPEPAR